MTDRSRSRFAWALGIVGLVIVLATLPLAVLNRTAPIADLVPTGFVTVGALVAARRPRNLMGWLFCGMGLSFALAVFSQQYATRGLVTAPGSLPGAVFAAWVLQWVPWFAFPGGVALTLLLFPTGRPPSLRWRPLVWAAVAIILLMVLDSMVAPGELSDALHGVNGSVLGFRAENPFGLPALAGVLAVVDLASRSAGFLVLLPALAGLIVRLVRSRGDEHEQVKWLAFVGGVIVALLASSIVLVNTSLANPLFTLGIAAIFLGIPAAAGIAILKYRLYDIDLVINRTLVFGALAVMITAVYVGVVVGIGSLLGSRGRLNLPLSILATTVVAIAFQPAREWVQRLANRLIYGRRATPYELMADFVHRMAGVLSVEDALPRMAEAAMVGVGAAAGRVAVMLPDGSRRSLCRPDPAPPSSFNHTLPVTYQGELIGEIAVAKPAPEQLTPSEARLLGDLAAQAGLVLHNVRLTAELESRLDQLTAQAAELRASRQRIVSARETEQRRLEADIREGVQTQLKEIATKLESARPLVQTDPQAAAELLERLTDTVQQTLGALRELARGVFPPLLVDRGIVPALRAQLKKSSIPASVDVPEPEAEARYDPRIEAAVYFSCVEALRAATASTVIHVQAGADALHFSIDDLQGVARGSMQASADRIAALDGSLLVEEGAVSGQLPLRVPA